MQEDYTGVTKNNRTLTDLFDSVSVQLKSLNGTTKPVFILHTSLFDEAFELLQAFPINFMPVSIHALRLAIGHGRLPLDDYQPPKDSDLTIELSVDDFDPYHVLYSVTIPRDLHDQLAQANLASKDFAIVLKGQKQGMFGKSQVEVIRRQYKPYVLDWWGILGYAFTVRRQVDTDRGVDKILNLLFTRLQENGPATGIFTELGYLYRMIENWEEAVRWYREEVRFNMKQNGKPGLGALRALSNLGVVYKRLGDFAKARDYFTLALALNPNYFESLVSIGGMIDDPQTMLTCITRAYAIRPRYPIFIEVFEGLGQRFKRSPEDVARKIEVESLKVNLLNPPKGIKLEHPDTILKRLDFCINTQADVGGENKDNRSRIAHALASLLQRSNADAFVIFEEKASGKFVQFAGSIFEELLLDLPSETLSQQEMERAKSLFGELGISGPETYLTYTDPSLETVSGMQTSFNMKFGRDFKQAAEVTLAIFERVYEFPSDFQLVLKEN